MSEENPTTDLSTALFGNKGYVRWFVDTQGMTWWVAQDVAAMLGLQNITKALQGLRPKEKDLKKVSTHGGPQTMWCINEQGAYRLIMRSHKSQAVMFQDWLFYEVIPSIRQTGTYIMPEVLPAAPEMTRSLAPFPTERVVLPGIRRPMPDIQIAKRVEVSWPMAQAWHFFRTWDAWICNRELAARTGLKEKTVRSYTYYFFSVGLLACQEVFPRHLYRLKHDAENQFPEIVKHLDTCYEILMDRAQF